MWWITLIVLAIITFFLVKYITARIVAKQAEQRINALGGANSGSEDSSSASSASSSQNQMQSGASPGESFAASGSSSSTSGNQTAPASSGTGGDSAAGSSTGRAVAAAAAMGATGAAAAGAIAGRMTSAQINAAPLTPADFSRLSTEQQAAVHTDDVVGDVREMLKILNFAGPDAKRLAISADQLMAIRNADTAGLPSAEVMQDVAARLRKMLD